MYLSEKRQIAEPVKGTILTRQLDQLWHAKWDAYVKAHPLGTFFHLSGWDTFYGDYLKLDTHYLMAVCDGQIQGVLPLARIKSRLFSDALISTPFCVYGGILASDEAAQAHLVSQAKKLSQELGVDYLELRQTEDLVLQGHTQDQYVTFKKPLEANLEDNLKAIPRKQRAVVRKAMKRDLRYRIDEDVDDFYHLYSQSVRNLGTPVMAKAFYHALKQYWQDKVDILTVLDGNVPISSVLNFYYKDQVLPFYGGGGDKARGLGANDFMYWSLMEHALHRECRVFDFGRSKKGTGSYRFKKHWGFEESSLNYRYIPITKSCKPNISPTNPKYQMMIKIWKKLPLRVANTIGPYVARSIG